MKPSLPVLIVLALGITPVAAQVSPVTARKVSEPAVTERGPHHRVWTRVMPVRSPDGQMRSRTNTWVELQSGLHRWDAATGWVETDPRIELFQGGAVVRGLQYQVIFAPNLAAAAALDVQLPDGSRLVGQILGLAYVDGDKSALIAEIKDCAGEVGGAAGNELLFRDAFSDYLIDVQYVCRRGVLSQNLILRERLASPTEYGLSENAQVVVMTEFVQFPQDRLQIQSAPQATALPNEQISFGAMQFLPGSAFALQDSPRRPVGVSKTWEVLDGRTFLLERVLWRKIAPEVQKLPAQASVLPSGPGTRFKSKARLAQNRLPLPARRQARAALKPIQMARPTPAPSLAMAAAASGYVLDFELATSATNFTFQGDTTYYVSGPVVLSGTTTFEGGAVIKYANTNSATLYVSQAQFNSTNYLPVHFTARDDHSAGETLTTNALAGYYAAAALTLDYAGAPYRPHHLRISHAQTAIHYVGEVSDEISHGQITHCGTALVDEYCSGLKLQNVLVYDVGTFLAGDGIGLDAAHLTLDRCDTFRDGQSIQYYPSFLTNCILTGVTNLNLGYATTEACYQQDLEEEPVEIYQSVGAAGHYLATNSVCRDAGSTNLPTALRAELQKRTTYPPVVLSSLTITGSVSFSAQAQRDTDTPDLGYHYDPVDYALGSVYFTNATVTLQAGTALGIFAVPGGDDYGLSVGPGTVLTSDGTPTSPVRLASYNLVQEPATTNWAQSIADTLVMPWNTNTPRQDLSFRFTEWSRFAGSQLHLNACPYYPEALPIRLVDCAFHGGLLYSYGTLLGVTNCLFDRVILWLNSNAAITTFRNCLFRQGTVSIDLADASTLSFRDNLFDRTTVECWWSEVDNGYNAYVTNYAQLAPASPNDVILTSVTYQAGPLGPYYYPTNSPLINAGSTNASLLSLYHHTTTTNQVKETTSIVDIGYHYVAVTNVAGVWVPIDTDGDGLADYFEDKNGNGAKDASETDWTLADTDDDGLTDGDEVFVYHTNPTVADTDGDGLSDGAEVLIHQSNPNSAATLDTTGTVNLNVYTPLK